MGMDFNSEILCIDSTGKENLFCYSMEESEEQGRLKWVFKVMPSDLRAADWYEFAVTKINDTTGKVTVMENRNMIEYRGMGITERLIDEANRVLNLTIISSTNNPEGTSLAIEWRSDPATKIWERLKAKGRANHNKETDIYTYISEQT